LQRGWAGNMDEAERAYIKRNNIRSPKQKVADERFRNRMLARRSVWTCPNVASILRSDTLRDKDRAQRVISA
jgi:hypothetical protein